MRKLLLIFAVIQVGSLCQGQNPPILPEVPARGYVVDKAHLISDETRSQINSISDDAKRTKNSPIVVVTIESLRSMNAGGWTIEAYATHMFDTWEIGTQKVNHGVLLLVSKGDRKARIETGAGWSHSLDYASQGIMNDTIVPRFKSGDYDGGILAGVRAIDNLIQGKGSAPLDASGSSSDYPNPTYSTSTDYSSKSFVDSIGPMLLCPVVLVVIVILGLIGSFTSGGRRYYGNGGYWGGGFYGGSSSSSFSSGSSGGGFSGGSSFSGGGSSGGGGASGSW